VRIKSIVQFSDGRQELKSWQDIDKISNGILPEEGVFSEALTKLSLIPTNVHAVKTLLVHELQ
jgi:hypothetical protein